MKKTIIILAIIGTLLLTGLILTAQFIGFSNREITLKNSFEQKMSERKAFYNKMYMILSQKGQIALKNDSSFRTNVNMIMEGRKDAGGLFMKWVQESNPNANYEEVTALYKDLSRTVEAQREGFFVEEKYLQDVKLQHQNLVHQFPGSFYNRFYERADIVYTPISSTVTEEVFKTGIDDNVKVF